MFNETYDKLLEDNCVAIFPEGGSHDRPDVWNECIPSLHSCYLSKWVSHS